MKILLIQPPSVPEWSKHIFAFEPLALEYIGAGLKQDGHNVQVVDARFDSCTWRIGSSRPCEPDRPLLALMGFLGKVVDMKHLLWLILRVLSGLATLLGNRGTRAVLAENLLLKRQLLVLRRSRRRAPNLRPADRWLFGFCSLFLSRRRLLRTALILRPSTLLRFHRGLKQFKYRLLYSSSPQRNPGPKGPAPELIQAICELKRRNPRFGCPKIAQHLAKAFGIAINKDVVRRVLAAHYRPERRESGPSWLTFLGHAKDSLWSVDLFQTESILLRTHWILVIMDQFTRRIIGFGVQAAAVDGLALCRIFNQAISGQGLPVRLSLDHDPLFEFQRWQANLRVLGVEAVPTVPQVPWSHPFVERLVGTIRREYLDHLLFWNAADLERKLELFQRYYNGLRVHQGLDGDTPDEKAGSPGLQRIRLDRYAWQSHCHGLFELPIAA